MQFSELLIFLPLSLKKLVRTWIVFTSFKWGFYIRISTPLAQRHERQGMASSDVAAPLSQPLPSPSLSWTFTVVDHFSSPRWSTEWARLAERYIGLCRWQYQTPSTWAAAVDQQQITAAVNCAALGKEADCNYGERTAESIFSGVLVLSEKVVSAWDAQDTHCWRKYPLTGWL